MGHFVETQWNRGLGKPWQRLHNLFTKCCEKFFGQGGGPNTEIRAEGRAEFWKRYLAPFDPKQWLIVRFQGWQMQ